MEEEEMYQRIKNLVENEWCYAVFQELKIQNVNDLHKFYQEIGNEDEFLLWIRDLTMDNELFIHNSMKRILLFLKDFRTIFYDPFFEKNQHIFIPSRLSDKMM